MRLEPDLSGLLKALARVNEAAGVKSAGGRMMFATEVFLSSLAVIVLSMALLHEIIEEVAYLYFQSDDFASHTLIYVAMFMAFILASLVLVLVRELVGKKKD